MHDFFQIGYLFAIGGGVIGSVWSSMKDHDAPVSSLFEALISAVAAAAVAERFLMLNQVWTCAIAGAFIGILTGHAMDIWGRYYFDTFRKKAKEGENFKGNKNLNGNLGKSGFDTFRCKVGRN